MALYWLELILAYLLYFSGIYWICKKYLEKRGARTVLVYHRVLPGKSPFGSMVGERSFVWQIEYISRNFVPVGWEKIIAAGESKPGIKVLVTFDDGYRDNFTRALPVLERYCVPAIFFAVTDFIFHRSKIEPDDAQVNAAADVFPTEEELRSVVNSRYVDFGNHTATHKTVARMSQDELLNEIRRSQNEFEARLQTLPAVFAYPRGREEDIAAEDRTVFHRFNIQAAFTMIPGLVNPRGDPYLIPRIGVSHVNNRILFKVKTLGLLRGPVKLRNRLTALLRR